MFSGQLDNVLNVTDRSSGIWAATLYKMIEGLKVRFYFCCEYSIIAHLSKVKYARSPSPPAVQVNVDFLYIQIISS